MMISAMGKAIAIIAANGCSRGDLLSTNLNVSYSFNLLSAVYKNNININALIRSAIKMILLIWREYFANALISLKNLFMVRCFKEKLVLLELSLTLRFVRRIAIFCTFVCAWLLAS